MATKKTTSEPKPYSLKIDDDRRASYEKAAERLSSITGVKVSLAAWMRRALDLEAAKK